MDPDKLDGKLLTKHAHKIISTRGIPYKLRDDFAQEAVLHVLKVLTKYDPTGGATVYTWAYRVMDRFVAQAKRDWFTEQKREQKMREKLEFIASIWRHRKALSERLKPATIRVAFVLLRQGWISDMEIADLAKVRTAGSERAHISLMRKVIESIENQ